jgi:hypothetical protein
MDGRLVVWNARGLNRRARRTAVQELVRSERASFVCLQETKPDILDDALVKGMLGPDFDSSLSLLCIPVVVFWSFGTLTVGRFPPIFYVPTPFR